MKTSSVAFMCSLVGLMLPFISCHYENTPTFHVTCDATGITLVVTFEKPFKGIIFTAGHVFDHQCSVPAKLKPSDLTLPLFLPSNACGTRVLEMEGALWMSSHTVVQQHRLLKTAWDVEEELLCRLPHGSSLQSVPIQSHHYQSKGLDGWINLDLDTGVFGEKAGGATGDKLLLIIYAKHNKNENLKVQNCVAHNEEVITEGTKVIEMYDAFQCGWPQILTEFEVTKNKTADYDFMAFATFKGFKIKSGGKLHLTCSLQACEAECPDYCENPSKRYYFDGIIKKRFVKNRLTKRSGDMDPKSLAVRSLEARHTLMKATINALAKKLMKYNRRPKVLEDASQFEKRFLNPAAISTSPQAGETTTEVAENESGVTEQMINELKTSTLSTNPAEISILEPLRRNSNRTSPNSDAASEVLDDLTVTPTLRDTLHSSSTNSSNNELNLYEGIYIFNVTKDVTILSENDLSSSNDDILNSQHSDGACVPKLRFAMTTGVLSFILFCLILTCIALTIRMRKEKKKHLIDSFLLYNFY